MSLDGIGPSATEIDIDQENEDVYLVRACDRGENADVYESDTRSIAGFRSIGQIFGSTITSSSNGNPTDHAESKSPCVYCEFPEWLRHPKFIYFTTDRRRVNDSTADSEPRGDKHIGFSKQPFARINQQNRIKGYHTGSKSTNLHGPHWQPELILGPFFHQAQKFKDDWRESSRGMVNRYKRAADIWRKAKNDKDFCNENHPRSDLVSSEYILERLEERTDEIAMEAKQLALQKSIIPEIFCRDKQYTQKVFNGRVKRSRDEDADADDEDENTGMKQPRTKRAKRMPVVAAIKPEPDAGEGEMKEKKSRVKRQK